MREMSRKVFGGKGGESRQVENFLGDTKKVASAVSLMLLYI